MYYCPLARAGFTKGCIDGANEMGYLTLAGYKDIIKFTLIK